MSENSVTDSGLSKLTLAVFLSEEGDFLHLLKTLSGPTTTTKTSSRKTQTMAMDPMTMPAISPPLSESGGGVSEVNVTKESEKRDLCSS